MLLLRRRIRFPVVEALRCEGIDVVLQISWQGWRLRSCRGCRLRSSRSCSLVVRLRSSLSLLLLRGAISSFVFLSFLISGLFLLRLSICRLVLLRSSTISWFVLLSFTVGGLILLRLSSIVCRLLLLINGKCFLGCLLLGSWFDFSSSVVLLERGFRFSVVIILSRLERSR